MTGAARQYGILGLFLAVACLLYLPVPLNHDAAWHLYTAMRVVAGDRLGIDVFDVNPPMSAWLFSMPAAVIGVTGLAAGLVFKLFAMLVLSLSWIACLRLLKVSADSVAGIVLGAVLFLLPGYDFAQREHLVLAFTLPYALMAARRAADHACFSPAVAALAGVVAAVGIGIKPHFLAIPVLLELWMIVRTRRLTAAFRPETLALFSGLCVYIVAVWLLAPAYLTEVVPKAAVSYGGFETGWGNLAFTMLIRLAPALVVLAACMAFAGKARDAAAWQAILMLGAGFLVAVVLQKKGWTYQLYPVSACLLMAAALCMRGDITAARKRLATVAFSLVLLAAPAGFLVATHAKGGSGDRVAALATLFRAEAGEDGSVFAFITSPRDIHPAVLEARVRWASASGVMVWLPAYLAHGGAHHDAVTRNSDDHLAAILADLRRVQPAVIVVNAAPVQLGIPASDFDYVAFTEARLPGFASLWRAYEERTPVGPYRVFVLKDDQTP